MDFGRLETGVIHGVKKNTIYKLRVLPYNGGGYGKKSTDLYFTLGKKSPDVIYSRQQSEHFFTRVTGRNVF